MDQIATGLLHYLACIAVALLFTIGAGTAIALYVDWIARWWVGR